MGLTNLGLFVTKERDTSPLILNKRGIDVSKKEKLTPNFDHVRLVVDHAGQTDEAVIFSRLQKDCSSCCKLIAGLQAYGLLRGPADDLLQLLEHPSTDDLVDYVLKSSDLWSDAPRLLVMMFHFCHCVECLAGLIETRKLAEGAPELPDDVVYVLNPELP